MVGSILYTIKMGILVMRKLIIGIALSTVCVSGFSLAQQQQGDHLGLVDAGIHAGMSNNAEMNRVLDDQDKKAKLIRPYFNKVFGEAQDNILAGKFDKAKKPIEKLRAIDNLSTQEEARLWLIDSWYYAGIGDFTQETEALIKLMPIGFDMIESSAFVQAGMRLLKRQYNAKDYGGAIETLGHLREDPNSAVELGSVAMAVKKLDDLAEGKENIVQDIAANEQGEWSASLLRPAFSIGKVVGNVTTVDFSCANKSTSLTYVADSLMSVPSAWGRCKIKVHSSPKATYTLLQTARTVTP
jgi:hypothetical protein